MKKLQLSKEAHIEIAWKVGILGRSSLSQEQFGLLRQAILLLLQCLRKPILKRQSMEVEVRQDILASQPLGQRTFGPLSKQTRSI